MKITSKRCFRRLNNINSRVKEQSVEYGHSFERELAYMVVHGFYHLMGYDHMIEVDKTEMRKKRR